MPSLFQRYNMSKTCQLFSGSSGNSIFISSGETRILIDAGVTAKRIDEGLSAIGESADKINAIFVTHEHTDHIKGLRVLASRYNIPVFTSRDIADKLFRDGRVDERITVEDISENMELGGIEILPFKNSHDSVECYGYRFNLPDGRAISVCTDTGYVTPEARRIIPQSDLVYLESNHEVMMLENGPYPYILKQRILSRKGHLSNDDCAEFARVLAESGTTRFVLAHLSRENNYPDIAKQTTLNSLNAAGFYEGKDFRLSVSSPVNGSAPILL